MVHVHACVHGSMSLGVSLHSSKTVCVCLSSLKDVLIGGFSDGRVTFYSTTRGQRLADISAHGRSITALDVVKNQGLVCSK